ncbi:CRISPR-associated endonuclease Cas2 [Candidatus Gottesmanbacteria bacterium]|nr:CRISPR-associated endonuclease Cas2 [Candidatus Gottesmanbacteria bacterium]
MGTKTSGTQWVVPTDPLGTQIFSTVVDLSLWIAVYVATLGLPQSPHAVAFRAKLAADRFLSQWNYETIMRAITHARRRKLLAPAVRRRHALPEITLEGRRRLSKIIPVYDEKRVWDARMHIITYDIPEKQHKERDALRDFIRTIGAAKLQYSVWITPYNPIDTLRTFIHEHRLVGTIIVSDMGSDASIGEEDLRSLVARVWRLDILNDRYTEWIKETKRSEHLDHWMLIAFLTILKDDPQLPFELLPRWWNGDKAYQLILPKLQLLQI